LDCQYFIYSVYIWHRCPEQIGREGLGKKTNNEVQSVTEEEETKNQCSSFFSCFLADKIEGGEREKKEGERGQCPLFQQNAF
jgi:hypothetical protein